MPTMQDVRAKFPQYDDMDDATLADALHRKFYADMPRADFDAKLGLASTPAPVMTPEPAAPAPAPTLSPGETIDAAGQRFDEGGVPLGGVPMAAASAPPPPQPASGQFGGAAMNGTAGINEAIYGVVGLPVDAARGAMNLGVRGFNAATGATVPTIPENSLGGSRSIAEGLGALAPELDPRNTVATSGADRIARATGQGIGGTIAPAAIVGGLSRAGALAPSLAAMGQQAFGRSGSVGAVAGDAVAGAASGLGAGAATEAAPEQYKPLAALAGGLAGGGLGAVAVGLPAAGARGIVAAKDLAAPLTAGGRDRLAGQQLRQASTDPASLLARLESSQPIVAGSQPTTFQQTGDMGLGALERAAATRNPVPFQERRAEQNTARRTALDTVGGSGAPESVSKAVRSHLRTIETDADTAMDAARTAARDRALAVGEGQSAEVAGTTMREALETARFQAKAQERALWSAVDPDGTLVAPSTRLRSAASQIAGSRAKSERPPEGEEAAILDILSQYGDSTPFSELGAMRSRLSDALRVERRTNGETRSYSRLSALRGALEADLSAGIAAQEAKDQAAVAAGALQPNQTIGARVENAPRTGNTVFTPSGRNIGVDYQVVEASDLLTSNSIDGRPDPRYPAELQPRDRSRATSDAQIAGMARNLQPERLGPSSEASTGAPIIGPDGVVESGNGRVLAIRRAYGENGQSAAGYRDYLASQGYDVAGMREPVLIRRRNGELTPEDRARFTQEANASSSMSMSASEQAATDASRLTPQTIGLFRGGDPASAENREFARAFLGSVADRGQEGAFVTGAGSLSLDGAQRMRAALLKAAYQDERLIASLVDEGDENIRSFGKALGDLSGEVARLKSRIQAGEVSDTADLSKPLVEAAQIVQGARARGVRLADAVSQQDAFTQVSPAAMLVLTSAYGPQLSGRLSREKLSSILGSVIKEAEQQTADARLFGDSLDIGAILQGAQTRYGYATQSGSVGGADRASVDAVRSGTGGSGRLPGGPGGAENSAGTAGGGSERILEQPAPNFDDAALGRLSAASTATRERAQTFDNKTLRPIRQRPATNAPYDTKAAVVPALIFSSKPGSAEAIRQFRRAAGDAQALPALESYAIGKLRQAAMNEDGTFDARKLATWRRKYGDALREFPELDARIGNAGQVSERLADVAADRASRLDAARSGAIGRLLGVDDPSDVSRTVGGLFGRQDSVAQFGRLKAAIGDDKEAQAGLRKAAADYIAGRFISNTEAATSGQTGIKSDQFQGFIRQNRAALTQVFSPNEMSVMQAIATDLQRSNRSLNAVRIPGQSNTAQDLTAVGRGDSPSSILMKIAAASGGVGTIAGISSGGIAGVGATVGSGVILAMRENGLRTVDDIVADALLNPDRARMLLAKAPAGGTKSVERTLAQRYRAAATALFGTQTLLGEENEE